MEDENLAAVQDNTDTAASDLTNETVNANTNTSEDIKNSTESVTDTLESKLPIVPDKYEDFVVPEGISAPTSEFMEWAKAQNMTQEAAQSAVDFYTKTVIPQQQAAIEAQSEAWKNESISKYGKQGIEIANKVLTRFNAPEFKALLKETPALANNPAIIGFLTEIGAKTSESTFVNGNNTPMNKPMYANSPDIYK